MYIEESIHSDDVLLQTISSIYLDGKKKGW